MTFEHCPRCLSSTFPKLLVGCAFCGGKRVQLQAFRAPLIHPRMDGLRTVTITPPPEQPQQDTAP